MDTPEETPQRPTGSGPQGPGWPGAGERFRVGEWGVDSSTGLITRAGQSVRLEPRVMDVLVYLSRNPGRVVTRSELEASVWAGTVVSYDALTGAIQKLRRAFGDDRKDPRIIETLSKRGYRLVAPVSAVDHKGPVDVSDGGSGDRKVPRRVRLAAMAVVVALAILATVVHFLRTAPDEDVTTSAIEAVATPSIAVLPFASPGGDGGQDYFADGVTDDLITALAKHPELLVIARDSSFVYRDQAADALEIARRLAVRYVLTGSVRRSGDRLRINVKLTDSQTGAHVWADTYDRDAKDIFDLQEEITARIVSATTARVHPDPDRAAPRTGNLLAYEHFLLGRQHFYRFLNRDENLEARKYFHKAAEQDPHFAMAWAMMAWTHAFEVMNGWSDDRGASLGRAHELADQALSLQEALPVAYFVKGLAYRETGDYVKALVEAEKAIEYDPNYANAHVLLATLLYYAGRPEEGLKRIQAAMRINPHHPYNYSFHLGQAYYILGRYPEAVEAFEQGIASNPASERLHVWQAAALAQNGALDDAAWEADQVLTLNPDFSWERMRETFPFKSPVDREHFLDGLRKAGLSG